MKEIDYRQRATEFDKAIRAVRQTAAAKKWSDQRLMQEEKLAAAAATEKFTLALAAQPDFRIEDYASDDVAVMLTDVSRGAVYQGQDDKFCEEKRLEFAAEAIEVEANALGKLRKKNLDWIAANDIGAAGCGFAVNTNQVTLYSATGDRIILPLADKFTVANNILDIIVKGKR